jgi:hypothetical protein
MHDLESPVQLLTENDAKRLVEIKKQLSSIPTDENSFLKIESLFYDVLAMARAYSTGDVVNSFQSDFKRVFDTKYKLTQEKYSKSRHRELAIKQFKIAFNEQLTNWIKSQGRKAMS